jgi:hypothetical protein
MRTPRHSAARAVLDCLDIAGEIVSFIDLHALLPVLLSDPRLCDAVRRILGPDRSLTSDQRFFVTSVPLTQWAIGMGYRTKGLCTSAALSGSMDVLKWLRKENDPPCQWSESTCHRRGSSTCAEVAAGGERPSLSVGWLDLCVCY